MTYYLTRDNAHDDIEVYVASTDAKEFYTRVMQFRRGSEFEGGAATERWILIHTIFKSDSLEKIIEMAALEGL